MGNIVTRSSAAARQASWRRTERPGLAGRRGRPHLAHGRESRVGPFTAEGPPAQCRTAAAIEGLVRRIGCFAGRAVEREPPRGGPRPRESRRSKA